MPAMLDPTFLRAVIARPGTVRQEPGQSVTATATGTMSRAGGRRVVAGDGPGARVPVLHHQVILELDGKALRQNGLLETDMLPGSVLSAGRLRLVRAELSSILRFPTRLSTTVVSAGKLTLVRTDASEIEIAQWAARARGTRSGAAGAH
jgi:hypothetical protein